jgi:hypothetical protein
MGIGGICVVANKMHISPAMINVDRVMIMIHQ